MVKCNVNFYKKKTAKSSVCSYKKAAYLQQRYNKQFSLNGFKINKLALTASLIRGGAAIGAMPFIDDALLWCPDNDGRMVDISACLPVSELFNSCGLCIWIVVTE